MIEIKQLQYLVICADMQSFSKAARALYTTQPNVSKIIRSLEEELGFELFIRQNRGIYLTSRGKRVYDYACKVMGHIKELADIAWMEKKEELLISCNPSSWMAASFAEFYNAHQKEDVCFRIITASTEDIIQRCADRKDDIGFVYIMKPQLPSFAYRLERNGLEFFGLKKTEAMLYFGAQNPLSRKSIEEIPTEKIQLVQCYEDEFTMNHYWDIFNSEKEKPSSMKVAVVTNSDYVMTELLENTDLGNISVDYLSHKEKAFNHPGVPLYQEKDSVVFGYIKRKEELSKWAKLFLTFVKGRLCDEEE
ncbi:MAG: LysR family transcriptional regulator [Lachnospiraceae bacterium]|nr:LysR family transcriptional regulator [Lachnospiraceae bacterium]